MYVCMYTCMFVYVCIYVVNDPTMTVRESELRNFCAPTVLWPRWYTKAAIYMCVCAFSMAQICIYIYIYMYVCMYVYMYVCVCMYICSE